MNATPLIQVAVGQVLEPFQVTVPLEQLVRWAGASGDFSPIHYDREYAQAGAALPDLLVHGPLKMALVVQYLTGWAGGDPASVTRISLRYGSMDLVNSTLTIAGTVMVVDEGAGTAVVSISIVNDGKESTTGTATVRLGAGVAA